MAYQVIYKKRFLQNFIKLLKYLEKDWSESVADKFIIKFQERLKTLSQQPYIGTPSTVAKSVRSILITKHNRIYYRIKGNRIEVINIYDTKANPKKNKYK